MEQSGQGSGISGPRRYVAVIAVTAATAAIVVDGAVATVALPTIAQALNIPDTQSVLIVTLYQFLLALCLIPLSALSDRFGLRRIFRAGLIGFLVAGPLCLLVTDIYQLLMLRSLQAISAALVLSVGSAQIRTVYPSQMLGRGLALNSLTVAVFTALSPLIGAAILGIAPWPFVFLAAMPMALIALGASTVLHVDTPTKHAFDWPSAALYCAAMASLFAALDGTLASEPVLRFAALATSAAVWWLLTRRAMRMDRPLFPIDLLAQPVLALSVCGALCTFASSMAVLVLLPFRLDQFHHFNITEIGLTLASWPLATMMVAPAIGLLSDRLPPWAIGTSGLAVVACALIALLDAPASATQLDIGWLLMLCGAGYAAYTASNARLILASAPVARAASVGGLIATVRILGQSIGAMIAAASLLRGWVTLPQGLVVPIVLAGVGMIISLARRGAR